MMKPWHLLIKGLSIIMLTLIMMNCQTQTKEDKMMPHAKPSYDSTKAAQYGADDYGMRKYVMAFLKRGPNRDLEPDKAAELQRAHLDNISRLAEAGKLVVAGPFFGDGDLRGIYIFNVDSIEAARKLTETDPAIKQGSLEIELLEWYGSAALMAVNEIHQNIAKKQI